MRILLTGSNGFVGARTAVLARARGHHVIGLGRQAASAVAVDRYVRHDLTDPLPADLPDVDAVIHCAALASPWAPTAQFVASNVHGTAHVVRWCRAHGSPHLVFVSSSSVLYRREHQLGLTEDSPVPADHEQLNTYARSKAVGERIVARYEADHAVLRPRAVFGPGDTVVLPRLLAVAARGVLPVLTARTGPGVRSDLTYVDTAAAYLVRAVERRVTGTYHVTNGEPVDLYPFLLATFARLGVHPRTVHIPPAVAWGAARLLEDVATVTRSRSEPLLTTFGASVLAYSKTFDPARLHRDLGPAEVSLGEGIDRLVAAGAPGA